MEFAGGRLLVEQEGPIGWLTFNQPDRLNAVRRDMWDAMPDAVASLINLGVRAIVLKGAGDKAFISGADIAEFDVQRHDAASNRSFTSSVSNATASLIEAPVPTIAMIHGFCIGGGIVVATACDIRICTEGSRFGVPAGRLGLGFELDNFIRLQSLVGRGMALEMLATARQLTALEAAKAGLVNSIVPQGKLEDAVREIVTMISANAPLTFAAAKLASRVALDPSLRDAAQYAIDVCFDSADFAEGRAAFHGRRHPTFTGR
jgi:enoyl-CoA hydratase/carnithine racemase